MNPKNVLIFADGIVAKHLLRRITRDNLTSNHYYIVYMDEEIKPKEHKGHFFFYNFDPTSFVKVSNLFNKTYTEVVIVLGNKIDTLASYENVRKLDRNVSIVLFDRWDLDIEDPNLIKLDANEILAGRLFDYLPDVPVIAQNVGLGQGEIMEVLVPFGSSYVYRHVGTIEQRNWRIAAIYRNNKLLLPSPNLMIWPNDLLLLIGDPSVLKHVFKSIKREVGQFPLPYGQDSYLFIDMERMEPRTIRKVMLETIFLHQRINDRTLYIRVVNPNDFGVLEFLKNYESESIEVIVDYRYREAKSLIEEDFKKRNIGLFILHNGCFEDQEMRKFLYQLHIPVLSLSDKERFTAIKEVAMVVTPDRRLENISATLFDLAIQLRLGIRLYENFDADDEVIKNIEEHFKNLAQIFSKPMSITKSKTNVIKELMAKEDLLLVYPFSESILKATKTNIFCTDPLKLFYKLDKFHQIFLPEE